MVKWKCEICGKWFERYNSESIVCTDCYPQEMKRINDDARKRGKFDEPYDQKY